MLLKSVNHIKVLGASALLALLWIGLLSSNKAINSESKPLAANKPNIIIVLTDDQGYGDVGFNGCKDIPTPNIDRLAKNGAVFSQAYVSYAVCAPSRAGLLTGRYQDRFGYSRNPLYKPLDPSIGLSLNEQLMPELLKQSGYATMGIGKWHLGAHPNYRPWKRGFDRFFGFLGGGHRYFPQDFTDKHQDSVHDEDQSYRTKLIMNEQVVEEKEYLTDAFTREAVNFIEQQKKQPFFLYLAYNAPHTPLQASEKYLSRFPTTMNPKRRTYAAMVSAVDDGVGAILNKLAALGIAENTIVIFLSDNGGPKQDNASDNGVLRGGKGGFFEGGIRVPFVMQWPAKISPDTKYTQPISSLDILATITGNVAGIKQIRNPLDGVNLIPFVTGKKAGAPHDYLFWRQYDQQRFAVLSATGDKAIMVGDTSKMLFHLPTDISEANNIANQEGQKLAQLEEQRKRWAAQMIPPAIWGLNQAAQYQLGKNPNQSKQ